MIRNDVLDRVKDKGLRVYLVWVPILDTDTKEAASRAALTVTDGRVRQYWDAGLRLSRAVGARLALPPSDESGAGVAWDVYLVYGGRARWLDEAAPPGPGFWMHQLGSPETMHAPRLDGAALRAAVEEALRARD